jgi:hypothetical protein
MNLRRFFRNIDARIPFSIIGVFVILGSSFTVVYLSRLEQQKSYEFARSLEFQEIETLLYSLETDLSNVLTIAGMKGLKEVGKTPVVFSVDGSPEAVNQYRVKNIIKDEVSLYLLNHYRSNSFSQGNYAINVLAQNESRMVSLENITLTSVPMFLHRVTLPFIAPPETNIYSTYWVASVCLTLEITTRSGPAWKTVTTRIINVSSILPSRYPLLESLADEYHQSINGTFSPLWTFLTLFSTVYSLIRGFKHYRCGTPLNIVDNRHLAVILNSGLLLEQAFVFGSADPLGLVQLAIQTKKALEKPSQDLLHTMNTDMIGNGYTLDVNTLSMESANVDAGDPYNETIDQDPILGLSEVAERILYNITSVTLSFENDEGTRRDEPLLYDYDIQRKISQLVQQYANQSFFLHNVTKHLSINTTTYHALEKVVSEIYQDALVTMVTDRVVADETINAPEGDWIDSGAGTWVASDIIPTSYQVITPPKGTVAPGCGLYEEKYTVPYTRIHYWWQNQEYIINSTTVLVKVWNNQTDHLLENVTLHSLLQHYARYQNSSDDIVDVLYENQTLHDLNLEDTLSTYRALYPNSDPEKQILITSRDNIGALGLAADIPGTYPAWVRPEAWQSVEEIYTLLQEIMLNASINTSSSPNPLKLIARAQENLLSQITLHRAEYLNYQTYHPGDEFQSVGKKAVYYTREWYIDTLLNQSQTIFSQISEEINTTLETMIPSDAGFHTQNITQTLDDVSDAVQNQFTIPFGYDLGLIRFNATGTIAWNESVRLAVDQTPDYLDPFKPRDSEGEELWTLKIRNRCLLGPTGLPLLPPTPVTPWLCTMNLWILDIQGEYEQVKLIDTSDETIFNPLLGHEPQTYVREQYVITASNMTLGENTRLSFGFTTLCCGLVPPWGMMIGDIQENWFDDHTPGFDAVD